MAEVGTRPSKYPEWASGVGADIVEPSGTKKAQGWIVEVPPHEYFNWLENLVYQWLVYMDERTPRQYDDLLTAIDEMADGDVAILNEFDEDEAVWTATEWSEAIGGSPTQDAICSDGQYVFAAYQVSGTQYLKAIRRDQAVAWTDSTTYSQIREMHSDGAFLWVVADNKLWKRSRTTGAAVGGWTPYDHGAELWAVQSVGPIVWVAGAPDGSTYNVKAIDASTGAVIQSYTLPQVQSNNYWDLEAYGEHAWVTFDSIPGNANLYKLIRTSSTPVTSTELIVSTQNIFGAIVQTETSLFVAGSSTGTAKVAEVDMENLTTVKTFAIPGEASAYQRGLAYDGRYLWVCTSPGMEIYCVDARTGSVVFKHFASGAYTRLCADVNTVYGWANLVGVYRLRTGKLPFMVRRVALGSQWRKPFSHPIVPFE